MHAQRAMHLVGNKRKLNSANSDGHVTTTLRDMRSLFTANI